jgi:hypothetical protein
VTKLNANPVVGFAATSFFFYYYYVDSFLLQLRDDGFGSFFCGEDQNCTKFLLATFA